MDFRSKSEQLKDPRTAMKRSLIFPGAGQIYNDQNIKGYALIAGEILALWSFNENREKYSNYKESDKHSRNYYLRERNRFAWIAIGLYFYGILDAVVEAHLDDFERIVDVLVLSLLLVNSIVVLDMMSLGTSLLSTIVAISKPLLSLIHISEPTRPERIGGALVGV